ncbi:hypothetical protein L798_02433 [Zootermopsis nevadensis]|uniref:Uncharacterized protein n=1 Tax=Zootermopsis nevadensis TaxID=136037 RepID=A0A067QJL3_ZOONE|nr:hypothetical protein L798_02433 [Zootermopsis nevadensis]
MGGVDVSGQLYILAALTQDWRMWIEICITEDKDQWQALMNTVTNLQVSQKTGNSIIR